jgi:ribonuclease D
MAWLIDPLRITDTAPLANLLTNPDVLKVLHSASEDLEVFQRWLGVMPQPLFDTQRAAALLNIGFGMGYRTLVQEICNVDLPKGETQSDWLKRPLTESQCEYAALDVTWLLQVFQQLYDRCVQHERLQWVLDDGRDATGTLGTEAGDTHKRVKLAWKLNRRQLGILVATCEWREQVARQKNKPRSWIIDDQTCLQLSQHDPRTLDALSTDVGLPERELRRYGDALLHVLDAQREKSDADLPQPLPAPLDAAGRDTVKKLKRRVSAIASELDVVPEVLLAGKDYELLLRERASADTDLPAHWQGWRRNVVIEPLRQALAELSQ